MWGTVTMVVLGMVSNSALDRLVGLLFGAWGGRSDTDTYMWVYREPLGLHCRGQVQTQE